MLSQKDKCPFCNVKIKKFILRGTPPGTAPYFPVKRGISYANCYKTIDNLLMF